MLFVNIAPKTPDVSFICLLDCSVALSLRSNYTCPILVGVARIAEALESDAYQTRNRRDIYKYMYVLNSTDGDFGQFSTPTVHTRTCSDLYTIHSYSLLVIL